MYIQPQNHKKLQEHVWLSSPTMHGEELKYITQAYDTNWMSTVGKNIDEIENSFSQMLGCKYCVALSSGTSALHMAMKIAGVMPGDRVLCSDMTFAATVNPVLYEKGVPVFVDTEYDTWNMDPQALERAFQIHRNAKTVVLAHLYGTPAKVEEIRKICDKHGAFLVEDAAESLGALYKGKQTGMFGNAGCISFNGNKIITGSTGGMFLTNDFESASMVRKLSTQSREEAPWYQHEHVGYNYRMSNVIAGVVRGQIPYLQEHIVAKREIYERYKEGFKDIPVQMNPFDKKNSSPNFWLSCIIIDKQAMCRMKISDNTVKYEREPNKTCPAEILKVLSSVNTEGRPIWKPMHLQPVFKSNSFVKHCEDGEDIGKDIFMRGLCLPSDNKMTKQQQDIIIEEVKSCFR